ncbi:sulfite oxidase-like oxidoreductase [Carbonactinospora thermoautotrophica]|nr:sulfite oxidase-like oxidoreductase [Carbonactinospora thermoautotrophica]MCX9190811.1 sulfite oxidase-like oxidoreductase [Carbonactinospora thermoautotrophica]
MAQSGRSQERDVAFPAEAADRLPPGQRVQQQLPVLHYGPVPKFRPQTWDLRVFGATKTGEEFAINWADFQRLPRVTVRADFHCVTKFSVLDNEWHGIPTSVILREVPPAPNVTHVMVWAEYGYSANMRLADFASPNSLLATHHNGEQLTPEHGFPVRLIVPHLYAWKGPKWVRGIEYLTEDRRGFWEERGYHNLADPWKEQRYSYQEEPGDGPEL